MTWILKKFDDLTLVELYDSLRLRTEVFVVEQTCPYPELDGHDRRSQHLFFVDEMGEIEAYCRLLPKGETFEQASIGRVCVRKSARAQGLGRELLSQALAILQKQGEPALKIEAQYYLRHFYASFGFVEEGEPFLEDGIKHIAMLKTF